jgi:hypothetical protein
MPTVIDFANQFDAALARRDAAALTRIIKTYGEIYKALTDKIDALVLEIQARGETPNSVQRMGRYKELLRQTEDELEDFTAWLKTESGQVAAEAIKMGEFDAARLVGATVTGKAAVLAGFNRLPAGAIRQVLGFLDPSGPLYKRMKLLPGFTKEQVARAITEAVGLGYNPAKTASMIKDAFGSGLTDALRMTRTVQLYSYREASRASYVVNSDVVDGWTWFAHLMDSRTCLSCIAQHGTHHTNEETLNDHHNGRCSMIPRVKGFDSPVTQTGEDWFAGKSEAEQRAMMGEARFKAWQDGKFSFAQLSREQPDEVYGPMRSVTPLRDLT